MAGSATSDGVEVAFVKASSPADADRTYVVRPDGSSGRVAVHVLHDLPHLVVESWFGIDDGLWAELVAGVHGASARATTARDPRRRKRGRIVSGEAAGVGGSTGWLTDAHRRAKAITNAVANVATAEPPDAAEVRARLAAAGDPVIDARIAAVDDRTIDAAVAECRALRRRWSALPPGATLRLRWPLPPAT